MRQEYFDELVSKIKVAEELLTNFVDGHTGNLNATEQDIKKHLQKNFNAAVIALGYSIYKDSEWISRCYGNLIHVK